MCQPGEKSTIASYRASDASSRAGLAALRCRVDPSGKRLDASLKAFPIGLYAQSTSDGDRSAAARVDDYFATRVALDGASLDGPNTLVQN